MGIIENPFAPGPATEPPHLAGREEQRELISETLVDGRLERSPLAPIKMPVLIKPLSLPQQIICH